MDLSPTTLLYRSQKRLFMGGLIGVVLALAVSLFSPVQYRADAQVYIISRSKFGVDPYTVAKSAERIGENLAQVLGTSDFYDKVMSNPNFMLEKSYFTGVPERTIRKRWEKTVEASVVFGTGVLNVSAYHKNPDQAKQYALAILDTLVTKGSEYVGEDVGMKVVNQPVVSSLPVRPNFLMNAVIGFVLGMALMVLVVMRRHMKMRVRAEHRGV